jgi:hypothetical protein
MVKNILDGLTPFVAIVGLCVLAVYGINNEMNEIATGCIGGITGLGFKLLEGE